MSITKRVIAGVMFTGLLCAGPGVTAQEAPAPEAKSPVDVKSPADTKPLAEVDALRLEKAEVEIQLLLERAERIRERARSYVREIGRRDDVEGWGLDLPRRLWVKPGPPEGGMHRPGTGRSEGVPESGELP